jgi:hypothetical protein
MSFECPPLNQPGLKPEIESPKAEVYEKPIDRLKREVGDIALGLQKEGVPVDKNARIDINKFGNVYSRQTIESDKAWVEDLQGRWQNAAASENKMSWLLGREQIKQKVAEENPMGSVWEMMSTKILHENLGKDFMVARTSAYDDTRYGVDNVILDRKTGHIICAFDEIGATSGNRFNEKESKVLNKNWEKGGTDLKYGISFKEKDGQMVLEKGSIYQIPLLYLALSEDEIRATLNNPKLEKDVFDKFVKSARGQIKTIESGPVHPKLRTRLDFFAGVLEKR